GASSLSRACAVHARTLEQLDARGLADELISTGHRLDRLGLFGRVNVDLSRLPSRFPFVLITPQYNTERLLERRARSLGARIIGGTEGTGLSPGGAGGGGAGRGARRPAPAVPAPPRGRARRGARARRTRPRPALA